MKKLPIKAILDIVIFISIISGIIYLQYVQSKKSNNGSGTYIRKKYLKELSCIPKKPIDKGVIFAEAMQQYWQSDIDYIWHYYERNINSSAVEDQYSAEQLGAKCGMEKKFWGKRWFSEDNCYPLVINSNGSEFVYKPEQDGYLYEAKYYDQDTPFEVMSGRDRLKMVYPKDCCRLLTYQEIIKEQTEIEKQYNSSKINLIRKYIETERFNKDTQIGWYVDDEHLLNQVLFLRIKSQITEWVPRKPLNNWTSIEYYPVSLCGKVPYFTYYNL
ncbi:MAG: hypothetical protein IJV35_05145 [Neisseriaceae bacterium]|nr:hypothetical protein [Neisseriaceae bacterium]